MLWVFMVYNTLTNYANQKNIGKSQHFPPISTPGNTKVHKYWGNWYIVVHKFVIDKGKLCEKIYLDTKCNGKKTVF